MLDETTVRTLINRSPLAIVVIGVFVFIIGAAGGLPIGSPPLQITDFAWRIGLGAMGLILAVAGVSLLSREGKSTTINDPQIVSSVDYGIKIESPTSGAKLGEDVVVSGAYRIKPPDGSLRLFTVSTDAGLYWPQTIVEFDLKENKWYGRVRLGGNPRYSAFIVAAMVDQSGRAVWNYYNKVSKKTNWTPIDGPFSSYAIVCDKITVERV